MWKEQDFMKKADPSLTLLLTQHIFFFFSFFFFFLLYHLWHMEVPGLGIESELQLLAYATATATQDLSHVYTVSKPQLAGNAGSLTHGMRPGIEPASWRTLCWVPNLLRPTRNAKMIYL